MKKKIHFPFSATKAFSALALTVLLSLFSGCKYGAYFLQADQDGPDERAATITSLSGSSLPQTGGKSSYSFIIFTDAHFGASHSRSDSSFFQWFSQQLADADESRIPRFAVNLGDTMNAGNSEEASAFNDFCQKMQELAKDLSQQEDFKVYSVIGNHDLYNNGWSVWKEKIWPHTSYYSFTLQSDSAGDFSGFSYYFLDTGNGTLGRKQLTDFITRLEEDRQPKMIFMHYPLYQGGAIINFILQDTMERNLLIAAFAQNNVRYVFEGHRHQKYDCSLGSFTELLVPSLLYFPAVCLVTLDEEAESICQEVISF